MRARLDYPATQAVCTTWTPKQALSAVVVDVRRAQLAASLEHREDPQVSSIGSIHDAVTAQVGFSNVRLREFRNNSAEKWRFGCQVGVFQDPADPAFSGAPVVGCDAREDRAEIRASALGPTYCQAIGPNSASNDFLSSWVVSTRPALTSASPSPIAARKRRCSRSAANSVAPMSTAAGSPPCRTTTASPVSCTLLTSSSARSESSVVETGAFSLAMLENVAASRYDVELSCRSAWPITLGNPRR
jgi:hypothetical protein